MRRRQRLVADPGSTALEHDAALVNAWGSPQPDRPGDRQRGARLSSPFAGDGNHRRRSRRRRSDRHVFNGGKSFVVRENGVRRPQFSMRAKTERSAAGLLSSHGWPKVAALRR
jgi:hypothetical protein